MGPPIVFVRHAETVYNVRGLVSGDPANAECVLSERGEEQARALGRDLAGEAVDLCVTSTMVRTRQTADLALAGRPVPRLELPELDELGVGELEGRSVADFDAWIAANGGLDAVPPGGESWASAVARWRRAFEEIAARPEQRLLVVAHYSPLSVLFEALESDHLRGGGVRNSVAYRVPRGEFERAIPRLGV